MSEIRVQVANLEHLRFVNDILKTIEDSAKVRGTGIAKRKPEYIESKILEGKAIIAFENESFVGFCYIETWGQKQFVANSGLIVRPEYRGRGIGRALLEACENALPTQLIHLCVRISNEEAIRMYKMAGYYNIDRWSKYYNDGEDSLVMEKMKGVEANSAL